MKKYISSFLAVLFVLLTVSIVGYADVSFEKNLLISTDGVNTPIEYCEVAQNDEAILFADMNYGYFALQSKSTSHIWYSVPIDIDSDKITKGAEKWNIHSQLVVDYIYAEDVMSSAGTSSTNSYQGCIENGSIDVKKIEDGIRVEYQFGDIKSIIPVEYKLTNKGFVAKVDIKGINESKDCYITDINLLPSFGAGDNKSNGQLFIPDGSGALINFNNGVETPIYNQKIYGDDLIVVPDLDNSVKETIRLPVFGTITNDNALMGIVIEGDGSSSIKAFNGNSKRAYNAVSSICNLRSLEKLVMFKTSNRREIGRLTLLPESFESYEVRYNLLTFDKANYVGIAEKYREYLIDEKGLKKQLVEPSLSLELYGAIDIKTAFLGFEYSKLTALTSFNDAAKIIKKITNNTDIPLAVRYMGWNNYGVLNKKLPTNANALSVLGGKKDFKKLISSVTKDNKNILYTDVDIIRFRSGSGDITVKDAFNQKVKHIERLRSVYAPKLDLDPIMLLTPQKLESTADNYLESAKKQGINSISLSTLGNLIYSNSAQKVSFHRSGFISVAENILKNYKNSGISLTVEGGNAYTLPYVDRVYNAPTVCSGYDIFDKEIPFYQIVLHGYVAMTSAPMAQSIEQNLNLLKTVESGIEFLYGGMNEQSSKVTGTRYDYLYSTEYNLWFDDAINNMTRYSPILKDIGVSVIVEHKELQADVMFTRFENGTCIITNYSNADYVTDEVIVKSNDYYVIEGGK